MTNSTTNACSDVAPYDAAADFVNLGWETFIPFANAAYTLATQQASSINNFTVDFHRWDASFQSEGELSGFIRPERPTLVAITPPSAISIPPVPEIGVQPLVLENAPTEPADLANVPTFLIPPIPGELDATRPGDAPTLNIPDRPIAPDLVDPDAPVLLDVDAFLPAVPDLAIDRFTEVAPEFNSAIPTETILFTETEYGSALLTRVRSQLTDMIDGTYYLPRAVADALWDQAVARDDRTALAAGQQARDQFAASGFDEPNGILAGRLREVQQASQNRRADLNREIYVRSEQVALENLRFAVQQALGLETTLLQAHLTIEERKFQLAVKTKDVALAVFNASVTAYNAAITAYNGRVDAYKAFLDGMRAEVELFRAQVEAAKLRGDINEQRVRMFAEQVRAQLSRAERYRAEIEGFKAVIDAERARIDGHRGEVDAYRALVESYGTEWEAYKSRLQAEAQKGQLYETLSRVHAGRISAWQTKAQVKIADQGANLAVADARLRQHDGEVRTALARLESARTLIAAQSATNDNLARMYQADASVESAAVEADNRAYQTLTDRERSRVELALKDAELQIQQMQNAKNLLLRALESGAQTSSQLAASAMSALNFSSSVSSSLGRSRSCSTNFSYSGEIADAGI